jgi:hypothetical protein
MSLFEYNVICSIDKLYVNNISHSLVETPEYKHSTRDIKKHTIDMTLMLEQLVGLL